MLKEGHTSFTECPKCHFKKYSDDSVDPKVLITFPNEAAARAWFFTFKDFVWQDPTKTQTVTIELTNAQFQTELLDRSCRALAANGISPQRAMNLYSIADSSRDSRPINSGPRGIPPSSFVHHHMNAPPLPGSLGYRPPGTLPGDFGYVPRIGVSDSPAITQDTSRRRLDSRAQSGMFGGGGQIGFGGIQIGVSQRFATAGSTNQASGNSSSHSNVGPIPPLPSSDVSIATPQTTPREE